MFIQFRKLSPFLNRSSPYLSHLGYLMSSNFFGNSHERISCYLTHNVNSRQHYNQAQKKAVFIYKISYFLLALHTSFYFMMTTLFCCARYILTRTCIYFYFFTNLNKQRYTYYRASCQSSRFTTSTSRITL